MRAIHRNEILANRVVNISFRYGRDAGIGKNNGENTRKLEGWRILDILETVRIVRYMLGILF